MCHALVLPNITLEMTSQDLKNLYKNQADEDIYGIFALKAEAAE